MDVEGDGGGGGSPGEMGAEEEGAGSDILKVAESGRNSAKWREPTKIGRKAGGLNPPVPPPPPENCQMRTSAITTGTLSCHVTILERASLDEGCLPFTTTCRKFWLESKWYTTFRVVLVENFRKQRNV